MFSTYDEARVLFSGAETRPVSASSSRVIAPVPSDLLIENGNVYITLEVSGAVSEAVPFILGHKLAENLHPVANPAYDRDNGAIYTTLQRLESKGYVSSTVGEPTAERGGRAKRMFRLEADGRRALRASQTAIAQMTASIQRPRSIR